MKAIAALAVAVLAGASSRPLWAQDPPAPADSGLASLRSAVVNIFSGAGFGDSTGARLVNGSEYERDQDPPPERAAQSDAAPDYSLAPAAAPAEQSSGGLKALVESLSAVGITEVDRERLSEFDAPRDPRRRYALSPQLGEKSTLMLNRGYVGFKHQVDESVGIGASFGESYDLADPEQKALKVHFDLRF